jgi:lipopolysaccharide/colanic/teichoic acid biosynthesis glycosyltransferase
MIAKRALDVAGASLGLLVSAPFLAAAAVAVKLEDEGPVLYRQRRVGKDGREFELLKLRTMVVGAEQLGAGYAVDEGDPRITRAGRVLRRLSVDELPQLWNVVRGDMSLVGPRPIRPIFFEQLAEELPAYWQRLVVRPGLTGFAQVRRGYETSMAEKLAHDMEWIADRSVGLYLRTLFATGWRVLRQSLRGAVRPTRVE